MLITHLPESSAVQRELHGEAAEWSVTDHLLAAAVDHLAVANWMFAAVNTGEDDDQPEPPKPIPRPGDPAGDEDEEDGEDTAEGAEAEVVSPHQLARFFG
ncbi:hypothetical protein ABZV60_06770 [Streptomyces sp. NPDC004787]|uniref:hypothetical protein n=1 Tax=Streptomyces sp. NPDC004787 TaxID=3154291 RepID=UPI0033B098A2